MLTPSRLVRSVLKLGARRYPLMSGAASLANKNPFRWASRDEDLVPVQLRDGSTLFVHLNDYVGRTAYYFGDLDRKLTAVCKATLRPGDVMLDIGGNYGLVTMQAAKLVGPAGAVHVFEPQPDLAHLIERSASENGYKQIEIHNVGLSTEDKDLEMTVPRGNRGAASVSHDLNGRHLSVKMRSGSKFLQGAVGSRRPRLIKIDVEGHESEVLQGAIDWIKEVGPEVLIFEHNSQNSMWSLPGVQNLVELGYSFYGVPKARLRLSLTPIAVGAPTWPRFHDIVAIHPTSDWRPPAGFR